MTLGAASLSERLSNLTDLTTPTWHFIGNLQSNKAKLVVGRCKLIQSVDSEQIAGKIAGIAANTGVVQDVLVEVSLSSEFAKTGVSRSEALRLCEKTVEYKVVNLVGLMGIAPAERRSSVSVLQKIAVAQPIAGHHLD